jgi:uncharacterized delta-60 repeat protein
MILRRFTSAGVLDTTYNGTGIAAASLSPPVDAFNFRSFAVQSDGKVVIAGKGGSGYAEAWRFKADGTLDTTGFGTAGIAIMSGESQASISVAVAADGSVLVGNQGDVWRLTSAGVVDATFGMSGRTTAAIGNARYILPLSDATMLTTGEAGFTGGLVHVTSTGTIDATFGTSGTAAVNMRAPADGIASLVAQADEKIVAVGATNATTTNWAVARYGKDGALDTTYGTNGVFVLAPTNTKARAGAIDSAGNVLVAGGLATFTITRVTPAGALDTTFGTSGQTTFTTAPAQASVCYGMTIDATGRIVVAGAGNSGAGLPQTAAVARLTSKGVLDTSFNVTGIVTTPLNTTAGVSNALAVTMQKDGKVLIAGSASSTPAPYAITVARYTDTGALDTTFNTTGFNTFNAPVAPGTISYQAARAIALQPDGKIILVGSVGSPLGGIPTPDDFWLYLLASKAQLMVARLNPDGTLDNGFGAGGIQVLDFGMKIVIGDTVRVLADGSIVAGGSAWDGTKKRAFITHLTAAGTVDNSAAGITLVDVGAESGIADLLIQKDGSIVGGGNAFMNPTGEDFALMRFK